MMKNTIDVLSAKDLDLISQGLRQNKALLVSYQQSKKRIIVKEVIPLKP